ncbi:MAG TPA: hypothetical protein VLC51_03275 [Nitrospira sp.]|nr:hypothetical protein [Nitrospira sp.]
MVADSVPINSFFSRLGAIVTERESPMFGQLLVQFFQQVKQCILSARM